MFPSPGRAAQVAAVAAALVTHLSIKKRILVRGPCHGRGTAVTAALVTHLVDSAQGINSEYSRNQHTTRLGGGDPSSCTNGCS